MINFNSVREIQDLLEINNLAMSKRFGQNFLISEQAREQLISLLDLTDDSKIWEIGPGIGAMSFDIARRAKSLYLFEIDKGFIRLLNENLVSNYPNTQIIEGDILKTWKSFLNPIDIPDVIFGNLPYYISGSIIEGFIEHNFLPKKMVFTIQKELAQRLCATANNKNFSYLSLVCQLDYKIEIIKTISKNCFYPIPEVESSIIEMRLKTSEDGFCREDFLLLAKDLFAARRKTIQNNLKSGNLAKKYDIDRIFKAFSDANIELSRRGETLEIGDYMEICKKLSQASC
ncbi:MAG: ribosomal RNA small subunit methyltransferase A [Spirochaetales bacterium]|nr:ribosomal RNA small subunit methyltransferase A [Spirochaetales bacterium]